MSKTYKTAIVAIAKDEEKFIQEWTEWHVNLGFTSIFVLDNNPGDRKLDISLPGLEIIPYNDIDISSQNIQSEIYNKVYQDIIKPRGYDYFTVIDLDEFYDFKGHYTGISDFIDRELESTGRYSAEIYWEVYDDSGYIYESELPGTKVTETYTNVSKIKHSMNLFVNIASEAKPLVKVLDIVHTPFNPKRFNIVANELIGNIYNPVVFGKDHICLRHYRYKCLETYIKHKYLNQRFTWNGSVWSDEKFIVNFFKINLMTKEKLDAFQDILGSSEIPYRKDIFDKLYSILGLSNPY